MENSKHYFYILHLYDELGPWTSVNNIRVQRISFYKTPVMAIASMEIREGWGRTGNPESGSRLSYNTSHWLRTAQLKGQTADQLWAEYILPGHHFSTRYMVSPVLLQVSSFCFCPQSSSSVLLWSAAVLGKPGRAGVGIFVPTKWRWDLVNMNCIAPLSGYRGNASRLALQQVTPLHHRTVLYSRKQHCECSVEEVKCEVTLTCNTSLFH